MAHDPRLEVYKIQLKRKNDGRSTFREFFRAKFNHYHGVNPKPSNNHEIFAVYFKDFVNAIGVQKFKTDEKKQKGFTIAKNESASGVNTLMNFHSDQMIIEGILEGGKFNKKRWLGSIENTNDRSPIGKKNIVSDHYYILLFTPLDYHEAVLILQSYSGAGISDVVRKHLVNYFKSGSEWSNKLEVFIPESYRETYKTKARFKKAVFSSKWQISDEEVGEFTGRNSHDLTVKIEITDNNIREADNSRIQELIKWFSKSVFRMKNFDEKELSTFEKKEAKMESNGKTLEFDIENSDVIIPKIPIEELGFTDNDGDPDFEQIAGFCKKLLEEIKNEILPSNAVSEF